MKESEFNKKVQDLIEAHGGYVIKVIASSKSGTHDMLACINGRFCSFEGKLAYNKLSPLQIAHRTKVIKAGGLASGIKTLDDAQQMIEWAQTGYMQKLEDQQEQLKTFSL